MVFFFIILNAVVAFIVADTTPSSDDFGCDSNGNTTTCEGNSPSGFLDTFFDVSITGIDDAPAIVNGLYVLISVGVLVIGFALIISGIIGTPFGAG